MASKSSRGSWSFEDMSKALYDYADPSIHPDEPITQKIETGLMRAVPYDLYPWVLETISKDGFIMKNLALSFLRWVVADKMEWKADPDKLLSIRRIRVGKFCELVRERHTPQGEFTIVDASVYVAALARENYFNLTKSDFSNATMHIAASAEVPVFGVFRVLSELHAEGYDISAALASCAIWYKHIGNDKVKQPSLL